MLFLKIFIILFFILWIVSTVLAYDYGRIGRAMLKQERRGESSGNLPPLSVIIPVHNHAQALRRHLPAILSQDYEQFEIIIVNMSSTDETLDVIERMELQYANLRHTYTPRSARDISIERLALTLGIRSASYDWVVITHPDCEPVSSQWLRHIGQTIVNPHSGVQSSLLREPDMIVGLARYSRRRPTLFDNKVDFFRLWNNIVAFNHVLSGHSAIRADGCNLAYRKAYFMEQGGFSAHQDLKDGAEELLVNYTSTPSNTALMTSPSAMVIQDPPPARRLWKQQRVFYAETRLHQRHAWTFRSLQTLRMLMPWLLLVCAIVLPITASVLSNTQTDIDSSTFTISVIVSLILITVYVVVKIKSFNLTASQLDYPLHYFSLLLNELRIPFWNLSATITHRHASKSEFRKKFI